MTLDQSAMDHRSEIESNLLSLKTKNDQPFFVIGYSRSGTTLLRLMLNAHPDLYVPKESQVFQFVPRIAGSLVRDNNDLTRIIKWMKAEPNFTEKFPISRFEEFAQTRLPLPLPVLFQALYRISAADIGKPHARWGHKKPEDWPFTYKLMEWYPEAQFIHIVRKPHDSVASMETHLSQNLRLRSVVPTYIHAAWKWRECQRAQRIIAPRLGKNRYFRVHYEDLVHDPRTILAKLCEFLKLPGDNIDEMLSYTKFTSDTRIYESGAHMEQTRRSVTAASVGRGEIVLPQKYQADIDFICGREMSALSYGQVVPKKASFIRRLYLSLLLISLTNGYRGVRAYRRLMGGL